MALAHAVGATLCYVWLRNHVPPGAAVWGSLAFALASYPLLILYHRGAFPEGLALEWLPGILWSFDRVRRRWTWPPALVGMGCFALTSLCNNPGAVVVGYASGIYLLVGALGRQRFGPLLRGVAVLAGGAALTAFVWFPAWAERGEVHLPPSRLALVPVSPDFLRLGEFRSYYFANLLDENVHLLGLCWLAAALAGVSCVRRSWLADWWAALALVGMGLWLSVAWSAWAYHLVPLLGRVQFPWRCLGMMAPGWALLAAYTGHGLLRHQWVFLVVLVLWLGWLAFQWTQAPAIQQETPLRNTSAVLADYLPKSCRLPSSEQVTLPAVESQEGTVRCETLRWVPGRRIFATAAPGNFRLLVRSYADPRWKAYDQDGRSLTVAQSFDDSWGRVIIDAPSGTTHIALQFETPSSGLIGRVISAAAVAIITAGCWYQPFQGGSFPLVLAFGE